MIELVGRLDLRLSRRRLPAAVLEKTQVFVNGDRVTGAVAVDTWQGWADVKRRDDRGRFVMLAGAVQIERRHGKVRIVIIRPTVGEVEILAASGVVFA